MDFQIEVGGEPPASARGGGDGKYEAIARAAREHPGEWIHVDGVNANVAGSIRSGSGLKGFKPKEHFEAKIAKVDRDTNQGTLWVRYIGEDESA